MKINGKYSQLQEEVEKLETMMSRFVFFNCMAKDIEAACVVEANCQLMNLEDKSDQCPAPEE